MPCTFDPGDQLGPFFNSIFWPPGSHPTATPLSTTRSPRSLSNDPAQRAATLLAYDLCPDLGILTKADRAWRQTQGSTWYTRHHTATLPSHLAKHTMGHNLLLALSYHVHSGLKRASPTIATAPRSTLHVAASILTTPFPPPRRWCPPCSSFHFLLSCVQNCRHGYFRTGIVTSFSFRFIFLDLCLTLYNKTHCRTSRLAICRFVDDRRTRDLIRNT
jgi:hypothetical protein